MGRPGRADKSPHNSTVDTGSSRPIYYKLGSAWAWVDSRQCVGSRWVWACDFMSEG
jgi:hypothetical protein